VLLNTPSDFFLIKPTDELIFPNLFLSRTPDDGRRNCPKQVESLDKNKFGKISASVGFTTNNFVTMHGHMNIKLRQTFLIVFWYVLYSSHQTHSAKGKALVWPSLNNVTDHAESFSAA
jgi:hypothetical protein